MLKPYEPPQFSAEDQRLFDLLVPFDHWTRRAEKYVDFVKLRATVEPMFREGGRPAIEPVLFFKIELLMHHDCLSDRQVFARAKTDLAYRRFLGLGRNDFLPDVSTLSRFRARLDVAGYRDLFHELLAQARGHNLLKDRLRLKDATHVLADIALPAGLQLVAQARNKLLAAVEPFDVERVIGERVRIESIRLSTDSCANDTRLTARVDHLRDILQWVNELPPPDDAETSVTWQGMLKAVEVARKVLHGHDEPTAPGKIRSTVDPDARRGKHGDYYDGYFVDIMIDADSELITSLMVLPANGNETADTLTLLEQEQSFHDNTIENISIDGAGFDGSLIRELESRGITTFIPFKQPTNHGLFTCDEFEFAADGTAAICPGGQTSQYAQQNSTQNSTAFRFAKETCDACPLQARCVKPDQKFGRTVRRNEFQPEYDLTRERAKTEEYAAVKKEHPRVERRLSVLVNRFKGRRARYRGLVRNTIQKFLEAGAHNLTRMIRLLDARPDCCLN